MNAIEIINESIKVVILNTPTKNLESYLLKFKEWTKLKEISTFHGIRPIISEAFKKCQIFDKIIGIEFEYYTEFQKLQSIINLRNSIELEDLLIFFYEKGFIIIPCKGVLFNLKLFHNQTLRESGDIDLLLKKENIKDSLALFQSWGGDLLIDGDVIARNKETEFIENTLGNTNKYEIELLYKNINFDIHWEFNSNFRTSNHETYNIILTEIEKSYFIRKVLPLPNLKSIFLMILVHNGAKENWFKLKHIVDLLQFLTISKNLIKFSELINIAMNNNLEKNFIVGTNLILRTFPLDSELKKYIGRNNRYFFCEKAIISYWSIAKQWDTFNLRLKYEITQIYLKDSNFNLLKYLVNFYKSTSKFNPNDKKRLSIFFSNSGFFNFINKILYFLLVRTR